MGEKGLMEEDEWQKQLEEDYIIVKWAQENVETLYNLLNKNMIGQDQGTYQIYSNEI